jgi:pimeloyl-ACP methyl ester carboxylesterase
MGWVVALALLAGLIALPVWLENRRAPVGEAQRRAVPGGFSRLSRGVTHWRWSGPEGGTPIVFVHGLTTSSYVFQGLTDELAALGFRALTYDLYGRGLSDRPLGRQTRNFHLMQLRELLQDQGVGRVVLAGYSMGGAIVTAFASEEPERVRGLVLLAPAGLTHRLTRFNEFCRRVPLLGDWTMAVAGGAELRQGLVPVRSSVPDIAARQAAETRTRGYLRSVLSSQRHFLSRRLDEEHAEIARAGVPVLAVWGEADGVIPLTALEELARLNPEARQLAVPGAGHGLPHTHASPVAQAIGEFVREI